MLPLEKMKKARAGLILDQPFFGSLSLRLDLVQAGGECETLRTNGKVIQFNPAFVDGLTMPELKGCLAHEVLHCALNHMTRRGGRDLKKWNVAADLAINPLLRDSGFSLPGDALFDHRFTGQSAEQIFSQLGDQDQGGGGAGAGNDKGEEQAAAGDDPGGCGGVHDAPGGGGPSDKQLEQDWSIAVNQAAQQAKAKGNLPGCLGRLVAELNAPKLNWADLLREFVERAARNDYCWSKPNSRYLQSGFILPSLISNELKRIVFACDTSGSIGAQQIAECQAELQAIVDQFSCGLDVVYCDAAIAGRESFEPGDVVKLNPAGGGGTDFRPVFDDIAAADDCPACLVYFTDLQGCFPDCAPDYPVLWVDFSSYKRGVPFGEVARMQG